MTELDIERLKAAALVATRGPWLYRVDPGNPTGFQHCVKLAGEFGSWVCDCLENADKSVAGGSAGERNATFIAAANPATVLELIAEVERLRAVLGGAEPFTYYKEPHDGWPEYNSENEFSDGKGGGLALYTAPPAPVSAEPVKFAPDATAANERHIFEFWYHEAHGSSDYRRDSRGAYLNPNVQNNWKTWEARSQYLAQPLGVEEVIEQIPKHPPLPGSGPLGLYSETQMNVRYTRGHVAGFKAGVTYGRQNMPPSTDAKDSERLDWLLNNLITFHAILFDGATPLMYRGRYLKSPEKLRVDIDAAIAAKERQ